MNEKKILLTSVQLRALVRYEMTFAQWMNGADHPDEIVFTAEEPYTFTLRDLGCALEKLNEIRPACDTLCSEWYAPIRDLMDAEPGVICMPPEGERPDGIRDTFGINFTERDYFEDVWDELGCSFENGEPEDTDFADYGSLLTMVDRYFLQKDIPVLERDFEDWEKINFVHPFEREKRVKAATEEELALCRRFTEELCAEDNVTALRLKGYACYGGNRLYPCDWPASEDCIRRLYDLTGDFQFANTLGYIYYYGRCTGEVPDYDRAFRYFTVAAAGGLYEGMYKIGDMLLHGYGCIKSPAAAKRLYTIVFNDSLQSFLRGSEANFADIALRMGNIYAREAEQEHSEDSRQASLRTAYQYYLMADYASGLRMKENDFFGNSTVAAGIRSALEETRKKLPKSFFAGHIDWSFPYPWKDLTADNTLCELKRTVKKNGSVFWKAKRLPTVEERMPSCILLCSPEAGVCERAREVTLESVGEKAFFLPEGTSSVRFDHVRFIGYRQRTEFYDRGALVAWIKAESFRLRGRRPRKKRGAEYTVVSVRFPGGSRTYDYLSDLADLREGDTVIVSGYEGETPVTVASVSLRREDELPLPLEKYKKILRKEENGR